MARENGFSVHTTQPKGCVQVQLVLDSYLAIAAKSLLLQELLPSLKQDTQRTITPVTIVIRELCGSYDPIQQSPPWVHDQPLLNKLYTNAALLETTVEGFNPRMEQWRDLVSKALLHGRHILHALDAGKPMAVYSSLARFLTILSKLKPLLPRILKPFKNDENVLFFILRRYKEFEPLGGIPFVGSLIQQLQPKGLNAMRELVISRYEARGFDDLVDVIAEKVSELQCQLS